MRLGRGLAGGLACLLGVIISLGACDREPGRLNVLFIIVDTLRADHLRCYGYKDIQTPHIDRLASRGVRFTDVVTSAPVTAPSIATILTSTYPTLHGVRDNELFVLSPSLPKIASSFREAGYATAGFVASVVLDERYGFSDGFDHYDDDMTGEFPIFSPMYVSQSEKVQGTQRRAGDVTEAALEWLEERERGRPVFCFVHYFDPHLYYDPPPPFDDRYFLSPYDGEVAYTDSQIGVLLNGLEDLGLLENTLVVFTSDHGEDLGQHGEGSHGFFLYDATVMVPLILSHPASLPSGVSIPAQARTVDIMPTVLDLAGLPTPESAQGESLAGVVLGRDKATPRDGYTETYHTLYSYSWHEMQAIRTPEWKYVRAPETELYDLRRDPGETNNLAATKTDIVSRMEAALGELEGEISAGPPELSAARSEPDLEMTEKMAALGYLGTPTRKTRDLPEPGGNLPDPKVKVREWTAIQEARGYLRTALALMEKDDFEGALHAMAVAESIAPTYAEVPATKGLIVKRSGDIDEGIRLMEVAVRMDPKSEMTHQTLNNLSIAYLEKERCEDAIAALERSLEIKPDYYRALFNLANTYERCGRPGEAAERYEQYLRLNPPDDPKAVGYFESKIAELRSKAGGD